MKIYYDVLSLKPTTSIGSQAYIISGMEIILKKYPQAEFTLLSANIPVDEHYLKRTGFNYKLVARRRSRLGTWVQVRRILSEVDFVVSSWGDGYITFPPHRILRKVIMLKKKGVPMILFTTSIGPFSKGFKGFLAANGLRFFDHITVRDTITFNYLLKLKIKNVKFVHDSAFVLKSENPQRVFSILSKSGLKGELQYVGVNISVLLYNLFEEGGRDYAKEMAEYVEWLNKKYNMPIILIPHQIFPTSYIYTQEQYVSRGGDDRYAISKIMKYISKGDRVIPLYGEYSPMDVKGLIKHSEIFIGGRMHSVIAAISTATPSLIMQYSHKSFGMMEPLGMQEFVWNINDSISILKKKTEHLWNCRKTIREDLKMKLPDIINEVYALANLLSKR